MSASPRRQLAILIVSLAVASPLYAAASRRPVPSPAHRTTASAHHHRGFLDWLTGVWIKAGCTIDPGGICTSGTNQNKTDGGCGIDPSGITCAGH